jgi:DNA-binding transcriptional LysR family regulator
MSMTTGLQKDFSLRQMEVMRTVVRLGSLTDAARFLRVSQPSISETLKQCSIVARFDLFKRKQGRLAPTNELLLLLPEFDRIFDSVDEIRARSADLREGHVGFVRIAATPAVALSLLPEAIRRFSVTHRRVRFAINTVLSLAVVDEVGTGRADVGLVMSPEDVRGTKVVDLWRSELVCVVPSGHPLEKRNAVSPELLAGYPLVSFSRSLPLGMLVDEAFRQRGLRRNTALEVGPSSMACALVEKGLGCAVVDPFVVTGYEGGKLTVLPFEPRTSISAQLLMHTAQPPSRVVAEFAASLRETGKLAHRKVRRKRASIGRS